MLSLNTVAKRLKVNKRTILREVHRGKLKASKVGNKFMVSEESIAEYLKLNQSAFAPNKSLDTYIGDFIESKKSEMFYHLQTMVATSSVNDEDNEEQFAKYIQKLLKKFGIRNVIIGEGDSVSIRGTYGVAKEGLLFNCPLDTVSAGNLSRWTYPPFEGVVHDGKMYGRGTADAKAGIVAMIYAVAAIKERIPEDQIRIELVFDGGEQSGKYLGMKEVLKKGLSVDAGIIGYGGDQNEVGIGARGYHRFTLEMQGQSVHTGSRTRSGVNAIAKMALILAEFESKKFDASPESFFDFGARMTVAQISGGVAVNVVPDQCEILMDFRTVPSQSVVDTEKYILDAIKSAENKKGEKFSYKLAYVTGKEGYVIDKSEKILKEFKSQYRKFYNEDGVSVAHGASHIGALFHELNIPLIVWGPQGENSHAYDEYVVLNSIPKTAQTYAEMALSYFGIQT